jgi:hypothetical protein
MTKEELESPLFKLVSEHNLLMLRRNSSKHLDPIEKAKAAIEDIDKRLEEIRKVLIADYKGQVYSDSSGWLTIAEKDETK